MSSRSARRKEKGGGRNNEVSDEQFDEGSSARTRPLSFDEIMSNRRSKKSSINEKEGEKDGACVDKERDGIVVEGVSDRYGFDKGVGRDDYAFDFDKKHSSDHHVKVSSRSRGERDSDKEDFSDKGKHRDTQISKRKLKSEVTREPKPEVKGRSDEKTLGRTKNDRLRTRNDAEIDALKRHSRDLVEKDRNKDTNVDKTRRIYGKDDERKHQDWADEKKNKHRNAGKEHDLRKGRDLETSERKDRKELSKSHHQDARPKRRWSRSQDREGRNRRSVSLSPRAHKRAFHHERGHRELPLDSFKRRSGRQHLDTDRNNNMNNGSSGHYSRHGGSTSGLGGYSPRKKRSEAPVKSPSPTKRSPEKRIAKWDLAPEGTHTTSASISSNFQVSNASASSTIHAAANAAPFSTATVNHASGVSHSALSINHLSVDSVQLTQATRPMRTLYLENVPASASDISVMEYLNNLLTSLGVNCIPGRQPCISCMIHKEKGYALVEFLTPEDASTALSLDGSSFSGSLIKVRRPKDFVEVASGEPEKSVAEVNAVTNFVKDSPHKIFIGGISEMLSSEMFMEIARAFGPLKAYQLVSSEDLNEPHAFLEYADHSVTLKACAGLNGMKLGGQVLTAVQAVPHASFLENNGSPPFYGIPEHAKPLLEKPTQVLKLKDVFDPEALSNLSHTEIEEILEDVRLECARFGAVKSVNVVKHEPAIIPSLEACEINSGLVSSEAPKDLDCNGRNAEMGTTEEAGEHGIGKSNSTDDDEADSNLMDEEPCQLDQFDKPDHKIVEQYSIPTTFSHDMVGENSIDDDNPVGSAMDNDPCQPDQGDRSMAIEDSICKSTCDSQEPPQQSDRSKVELVCSDEKFVDNTRGKDTSTDIRMMVGEVSQELKEASVVYSTREGSTAGKGDNKEQDCYIDHIFEPGCVLVEFRRADASCMAAHCLHGRLFDDRVVTVAYVPLDAYLAKFPR